MLYVFMSVSNFYSVKLWLTMAPYGAVYVFGGQFFWLTALKLAPPLSISIGTTSLFVLNLAWSAVLIRSLVISRFFNIDF